MATANKNKGAGAKPPATKQEGAADKPPVDKAGSATQIVQVPALSVTSSRDGFRRAGRVWGKEESVVKLSELSDEQIAQIKGEAMLTVTEIEVDEEVAA